MTTIRKIPDTAVEFIKREEGCVLHIYKDQAGLPTIGIGHLIRKGEDFSGGITDDEAEELFRKDLIPTAMAITRLITVPLSNNQYSSLLSFAFNVGTGALQRSTLRSTLNRGEYSVAADELLKWHWAGGRPYVLKARRRRERDLFLAPDTEDENE